MGRLFLFTEIFSIVLIILFLPVFISGNLHFDIKRNKYAFCLKLYEKIRIFGGYATLYSEGIALHVSDKKAILLPYTEIDSRRKQFSFVNAFEPISIKIVLESSAERLFPLSLLVSLIHLLTSFNEQFRKFHLNVWFSENTTFKVNAKFTVFFNNFVLLINLLQFLWRKIKNIWQEKVKKSTI